MHEEKITLSDQAVWIEVYGDLLIRPDERNELVVRTDNERDLRLQSLADRVEIQCAADCQVFVPSAAREVAIRHARKDVDVMQLSMPLHIEQVKGDLTLAGGQLLTIGAVGGDCQMQNIGQVSVNSVGGDCHLRAVTGEARCEQVGGDLLALDLEGGLQAAAGGDILARMVGAEATRAVQAKAGGDIHLQLPGAQGALLKAVSGGNSIRVTWDGKQVEHDIAILDATYGTGGRSLRLTAGGDISVTDHAPVEEQDSWVRRSTRWVERLQRKNQKAVRKAEAQLEKVNRRLERDVQRQQESLRRAESRLQAAMQRAEGRSPAGAGARKESPAAAPAEEKLLVLQMLQEKKISVEEADRLLSALSGQNE